MFNSENAMCSLVKVQSVSTNENSSVLSSEMHVHTTVKMHLLSVLRNILLEVIWDIHSAVCSSVKAQCAFTSESALCAH